MKLLLSLLLLGGEGLYAQSQTKSAPDCTLSFSFTSATSTVALNNVPQIASSASTGGCVYWSVKADTFNTGLGTIVFQSNPTSTTSGAAAPTSGWATFTPISGYTSLGTNPTSTFPSDYETAGYAPWLRVTCSAYTSGTIRGSIMGWRKLSASASGGGGSTVPGGNPGDIQFNNSGAFGGELLVPIAHGGSGTATPSLVAGTGITITGSWPNQTVNATGGAGATATNHQYYAVGASGNGGPVQTMNSNGTIQQTGTTGPSGSAGQISLMELVSGGTKQVIALTRLPSNWNGAALTFTVDAFLPTGGTGTAKLTPYSSCDLSNGGVFTPTWTAGTAVSVPFPGGSSPAVVFTLTIPITGCSANGLLYAAFVRTTDTFSDSVFIVGGDLATGVNVSGGGGGFNPTTQTDVTGSRSLGTVFHNTTAFPMWVDVITNTGSTNLDGQTDSANPPTTFVASTAPAGAGNVTIGFIVLPGNFYKVTGDGALAVWIEWTGGNAGPTISSGTFAALPAAGTSGNMYLFTDSSYNFARDNGVTWDMFWGGRKLVPPTGFAWQHQTTATLDATHGGELLLSAVGAGGASLAGRFIAYPTPPFTRTLAVMVTPLAVNGGVQPTNASGGLYISDGTAVETLSVYGLSSMQMQFGPSMTNITTNLIPFPYYTGLLSPTVYFRMDDSVTAMGMRTFFFSWDGTNYTQVLQESNTANLTPTRIGYYTNAFEAGTQTKVWALGWQ